MIVELSSNALETPLGQAIGRAIAASYSGLRSGTEIIASHDGETRVKIAYRPHQKPDVAFLPTQP